MPAHIKNYWQSWIETPFGNQDHILPEDWTENFWLNFDDDSLDSDVFTTSDCEASSTEEKDVHVVHHPSVIPLIELEKRTIIAVIPDPTYYEVVNEEPEPFWLA
jgi:hypothetical protein